MTFQEWWQQMTPAEQRAFSENNAKFVWEECQKHTLMTIEDACKAQVAYDQGHQQGVIDGQQAFKVHMHVSLK